MRLPGALIVFAASLFVADAAPACDLPGTDADKLVLKTVRPVVGDDVRLTSGFGLRKHPLLMTSKMHYGIDWAAPSGAPVIAAAAGRIVEAAPRGEYGNAILIDHGGSWYTFYSQLQRFADIRVGGCVAAGAEIAFVGTTGLSSGPHLHFEVRHGGKHLNPLTLRPSAEPEPVEVEDKG
jgi:murein DD-endopeptidase MepM/ murein hydrolase activator NlpD